jgi:NAD(P)-dependent dehydrogenase (short-subunit alcohol dehydrogenase family)
MRVAVVGANGTLGSAVVAALSPHHEVVRVTHSKGEYRVDLADPFSIREMYHKVGHVDAVISAAGVAKFAPFASLTDADFALSLSNKLMGQVNLVRFGLEHVKDGGSFTLTSGILARHPMVGSGAISLVNAGLEGFVRAAALEAPRCIRVNVVSPGWVTETLEALGMDKTQGTPAAIVARAYVEAVEGSGSGKVIEINAEG